VLLSPPGTPGWLRNGSSPSPPTGLKRVTLRRPTVQTTLEKTRHHRIPFCPTERVRFAARDGSMRSRAHYRVLVSSRVNHPRVPTDSGSSQGEASRRVCARPWCGRAGSTGTTRDALVRRRSTLPLGARPAAHSGYPPDGLTSPSVSVWVGVGGGSGGGNGRSGCRWIGAPCSLRWHSGDQGETWVVGGLVWGGLCS